MKRFYLVISLFLLLLVATVQAEALNVSTAPTENEAVIKQVEVDRPASEAQIDNVESRRERSIYLLLAFFLLTIALGLWYGLRFKSRLTEKFKSQLSEIENQKLVIEALRRDLQNKTFQAQFNPHFIFNTLNSIQYLIMKEEKAEAFEFLLKFAVLLRRTLEDSDRQIISLDDEIEFLKIYLELESFRFDHNFNYSIRSTVEDGKSVFVPPLILQPLVENAIVHGLASKSGERKLQITFRSNLSQLICEVTDTGIGREASSVINSKQNFDFKSKGIERSKQRLSAFNNRNDEGAFKIIDLHDANGPAGTSVILTFYSI